MPTQTFPDTFPDGLTPRRIRRRLAGLAAAGVLAGLVITTGPDLGTLRTRLTHAAGGWLAAGVALEILSALSYVVIFRAVFAPRMDWRSSYRIGMAEQAANSVLPVSGAGGLALGAWALRRRGMGAERIARRSVAFFFLTSLANVLVLVVIAVLYVSGVVDHDPRPEVTDGFAAAAVVITVLVLALPRLLGAPAGRVRAAESSGTAGHSGTAGRSGTAERSGTAATAARFLRDALGGGIPEGVGLLRRRPVGIVAGSAGFLLFDVAVLGVCFRAFGFSPPLGVLLLGYVIGQLGGNVPLPGGIGGVDGGLIATFALYHQPLAATAAAVLLYHAIAIWVPGALGGVAFLQLRRTPVADGQPTGRCEAPAAACAVPGAPVCTGAMPALAGRRAG